MKKIIFLSLGLLFLGCSQKTTYVQLKGGIVKPPKQNIYLNKQVMLNRVDNFANRIFSDLAKKNEKLQKDEYNKQLKYIYKQGL